MTRISLAALGACTPRNHFAGG